LLTKTAQRESDALHEFDDSVTYRSVSKKKKTVGTKIVLSILSWKAGIVSTKKKRKGRFQVVEKKKGKRGRWIIFPWKNRALEQKKQVGKGFIPAGAQEEKEARGTQAGARKKNQDTRRRSPEKNLLLLE